MGKIFKMHGGYETFTQGKVPVRKPEGTR